jgi:hypothetical protein
MLTGEERAFSRQEALDRHESLDAYMDSFRVALD